MPSTLHVGVEGAKELSRDLRAISDHLDDPIRETLARGGELIASTAKQFMRYRPEGAWKGSSGALLGHIRDYYATRVNDLSASIFSTHPAAPVWEWGGSIHPAGLRQLIRIPREHPVGRAGEAREDEIHRDLEDAVDRLIREHGFS